MAASRLRSPKNWTPPQRRQPRPGCGGVTPLPEFEREREPILRISRTGIRNTPKKQQTALRKERKADPKGEGVHAWRRRQR